MAGRNRPSPAYDIQKLSHQVFQPDAGAERGLGFEKRGRGKVLFERTQVADCCGRSLGSEAFGGEGLRRDVRDIPRRAPFFADLGKQPGLGRRSRPVLLRMIIDEASGLEDDGTQFGGIAATCRSAIAAARGRRCFRLK